MTAPSLRPTCYGRRAPVRSGFTLAEVIVSAASMGVLMVGIASAVLLASQALDDGNNPSTNVHAATTAVDQIVRDAASALSISEQSATVLAFAVPDRDDDQNDEVIRYAWSGTLGDPLTRQYNGGSIVAILDDLQEFQLGYDVASEGGGEGDPVEGDETLLIGYDAYQDLYDFRVDDQTWVGQYFEPVLPEGTTSWRVTRVMFRARADGLSLGAVKIQLREATAEGLPTSTVLEQVIISEWDFGTSYDPWYEVAFSQVSGLAPGQGLCLVFEFATDPYWEEYCCKIEYHKDGGATPPNTHMAVTLNGGTSWMSDSGFSLRFYAYGTVTGSDGGGGVGWVSCLHVSLRTGPEASTRVDAAVQMLNTPLVPSS